MSKTNHQHETITIDGEVYCQFSDLTVEDCEDNEFEAPEPQDRFTVTCNECGYSGSIDRVKLHNCDIQANGGRCEDFPCCGHTDGDGCQTLPEHTGEYWMNLMQSDPDRYDYMDSIGAWD